ncbi:MAG: exodeoxyribonuclease VII large subunit [Bacteroidota bacterium]
MKTYTLSDFTLFIRRILALNMPESVWVSAELGQVNSSRGHIYLTLIEKDETGQRVVAQMEGMLWRSQQQQLQKQHGVSILKVFQTGMDVRLKVTADFHDRYGFKLVVEDADPAHTLGQLALKRQAILTRLQTGGYLQKNKDKKLPFFPQRLAIVSSETAAGYADFRQQLLRNPDHYYFDLQLFPAAMQGDAAPKEIMQALKNISRLARNFDAVVIIRGGGARMDLIAFDDEALCKEVAEHPLPVIVGIGHETDEVLLDHVAHLQLKTPTAVAAFLLDQSARLEGLSLQYASEIRRQVEQWLFQEQQRLTQQQQELNLATTNWLQGQHLRIDLMEKQLPQLVEQRFDFEARRLDQAALLVQALDPKTVLERGYAIVQQKGKVISSTQAYEPDLPLQVRLKDGEFEVG